MIVTQSYEAFSLGRRAGSRGLPHDVAIVWRELSEDGPHLGRMP